MKIDQLPSALTNFSEIKERSKGSTFAIFLDYDGTLTPIVAHPEEAIITKSMRATVHELASHYFVAIISGRDLKDLKRRVGLEKVMYIGSHGFEIDGYEDLEQVKNLPPLLDKLEKELEILTASFQGAQIERKRFSIAVHFRNVEEEKQAKIVAEVEKRCASYEKLKLAHGKKVIELRPNIDWDKGEAVRKILLSQNGIPIYIGDDLTDEDAFRAIKEIGIGIVVGEENRETLANYVLKDPQEVHHFLKRLI